MSGVHLGESWFWWVLSFPENPIVREAISPFAGSGILVLCGCLTCFLTLTQQLFVLGKDFIIFLNLTSRGQRAEGLFSPPSTWAEGRIWKGHQVTESSLAGMAPLEGKWVDASVSTSLSRMSPQPWAALSGWYLSPDTFLSCVVASRAKSLCDCPLFLLCFLRHEVSYNKALDSFCVYCLESFLWMFWVPRHLFLAGCLTVPPVSQDDFLGGLTTLELVSLTVRQSSAVSESALVRLFLVVQWFRLCTSNAEDTGSITGWN